jgi:hypothetical protein
MSKKVIPKDAIHTRDRLIILLSLLTFSNIACFTIITSFTKSNFLNAIASSTYFVNIYNQKPYFLLYGLSGICFVIYICIYFVYGSRVSFERRIKRETLAMLIVSLVLYCLPQILPGFHRKFLPAMGYFVVIDIFDELIIVQNWSLINYCINIRESKRYQYIFLLSGSLGALISGYLIIRQVPGDHQLIFLLVTASFSAFSFAIINYIFYGYRDRINIGITATKESLKTLLISQKRYKIISSIVQIVILIGIFNLLFKVLFDVQINAHYANQSSSTAGAQFEPQSLSGDESPKTSKSADPKTTFIGHYKASISVTQVLLQLLFVYFFARLWLNGKVLYAYPLLLIPHLLFIVGVSFLKPVGYSTLIFWGTICACAINDLLKRVIFDSSYQLLMFAIPERLCNAIRMYSKLFFKPVFIIGICAFFLIIPKLNHPMVIYSLLIMVSLSAMLPVISRIPGRYVLSLRQSVQRRNKLESVRESLIDYKPNLILDQYQIVRKHHNDMFSYLYLLHLIQNSYASELDTVLKDLLKHENRYVRFETVSVIKELEAIHLVGDLEQMCQSETDSNVKERCLQVIKDWGPVSVQSLVHYLGSKDSTDLVKYNLAIVHRWGSAELQGKAEKKTMRLLNSDNDGDVLAGIWLVGELKLTAFKKDIQRHFGNHSDPAFDTILEALSKMDDLDLFVKYLEDIGFGNIRNYASLNKHLARFEGRAFDVIFDMLIFMTRSKSFMDLEKCLRTLRFLPSQDAVDFLVDTLFRFPNPHVKREALLCINRLRKEDENLDFDELVERLPGEIDKCRNLCADYEVIASTRPDSLLLLEMARKIETQVWMIFQILDLLNPELKVMDSFFRIKWYSDKQENVGHTRAKSIEYLEAIIKHENTGILQLLESIRFDDGLFFGAVMPAGSLNDIEDVYERIFQGQDYWLKLSAVWEMPRNVRGRSEKFLLEVQAMIPLLEKFHLIKDSPMLKGLSMTELMTFAKFMEIVDFRAADYVFRIGDPANALYKILEGKAELLDENQKRVDLLEAPFGTGFGFIIRKSIRRYALKCIEDCRMLKISSDDFNEILELNPRIYKNIFEILLSMVDKDIYRL